MQSMQVFRVEDKTVEAMVPVPSHKINAADVEDMDIGHISVQLQQEEDVDNREEDEEDVDVDVVEAVPQVRYRRM